MSKECTDLVNCCTKDVGWKYLQVITGNKTLDGPPPPPPRQRHTLSVSLWELFMLKIIAVLTRHKWSEYSQCKKFIWYTCFCV